MMSPHYDIAVIGGGPSGMMAALRAAEFKRTVVLFEKNASLGRKLALTGKGRCNITHAGEPEDFFFRFGERGDFLRGAFAKFFVADLVNFFEERGLKLKTERQERVFPVTDSAQSVTDILQSQLRKLKVDVRLNSGMKGVAVKNHAVTGIFLNNGQEIACARVIVAAGGSSYPQTGSTGDGFKMAEALGHKIEELRPGLVPLETQEDFVRDLQGLTLKNITITFSVDAKKISSDVGELLFTHFGVSGPLVLDLSGLISKFLSQKKRVEMALDLKPGLSRDQLQEKLQREWHRQGSLKLKNYLCGVLAKRLVPVVLRLCALDGEKKCHQVTSLERKRMIEGLKKFPMTIKKARPLREAMVTCGGVSLRDIDPQTMESRKVRGLYFCGEVLDLAAPSGGYNLQAAFSTGYLAGESAAMSIKEVESRE